jgi:hypothetical protein
MGAAFIGAKTMIITPKSKARKNRRLAEIEAEKRREESRDAFFCLLSLPLAIFVFYFLLLIS